MTSNSGGNDPLELALIVGAARSGTTLLRLLLDAHAEVACPAEAGVPGLMAHMAGVWMTVHADVDGDDRAGVDPGAVGADDGELGQLRDDGRARQQALRRDLPQPVRDWILGSVREPMRSYAARGGKRVYVDKSLDSVFHLDVVEEVVPGTRCILLFRHVMDTVASGIEASPWGFHAYGYGPYIQASPHNSVAALANYWLAHVTAALAWEEAHPGSTLRVRYEDLVQRPAETVAGVLGFLGVTEDLSVLERAFARGPARGPGDYKVAFTSQVHASSVGHGKRVPVTMLPPTLLEAVNDKLEALGYERLDRAWNAVERASDVEGDTFWSERLSELMSSARVAPRLTGDVVSTFALVADDHHSLRWVVDLPNEEIRPGDGEVDSVLTGTAEDLALMLAKEANLGVLLRSGRIRHVTASQEDLAIDLAGMLDRVSVTMPVSVAPGRGDVTLAGDAAA